VPNETSGTCGKNEARPVVEGDFGFKINDSHATRGRWRREVEELMKRGFIGR
jgi:hypothetical protein